MLLVCVAAALFAVAYEIHRFAFASSAGLSSRVPTLMGLKLFHVARGGEGFLLLLLVVSAAPVSGYWLQSHGDSSGTCFSSNSGPNLLGSPILSPLSPGNIALSAPLVAPGTGNVYVAMAELNGEQLMIKMLNRVDLSLVAQIAAGPLSTADMSTMAIQSDGTLWVPSVGVVAADLSTVLVPSTANPTFTIVAALGPEDYLVQASYSSSAGSLAQFIVSRLTSGASVCATVPVPVAYDFRVLYAVWGQSGGALYIAAMTAVDMQDGGSTVYRLDLATCALSASAALLGAVESLILSPYYLVVNWFHGAGFQTISVLDLSTLNTLSTFSTGDGAGGGIALADSVLYLSCGYPPLLQAYSLPTGTVLWSYSLSLQGLKCAFSDLAIDLQGRIYASATAEGYTCDEKGIYAFSPSGLFLFSSCNPAGAAAGCVAFGPPAIGADGELFAFAKTPVGSNPDFVYQPVKFFSAPSPGPSSGPSGTLSMPALAIILASAGGVGIFLCLGALAMRGCLCPACCTKAANNDLYSHLPSDDSGAGLVINDAPSPRFMASGGRSFTPSSIEY
jgi:hypothetical protein